MFAAPSWGTSSPLVVFLGRPVYPVKMASLSLSRRPSSSTLTTILHFIGWDEAVVTMSVGEKAILTISEYASPPLASRLPGASFMQPDCAHEPRCVFTRELD